MTTLDVLSIEGPRLARSGVNYLILKLILKPAINNDLSTINVQKIKTIVVFQNSSPKSYKFLLTRKPKRITLPRH